MEPSMRKLLPVLALLALAGCDRMDSGRPGTADPAPPPAVAPAVETPPAPPPPAAATIALDGARGFDVPERYPVLGARWAELMSPRPFGDRPWLRDLDGVSSEIRAVTVDGKPLHAAWVCQPHNCGDNQVALLLAPDQSRLVALVQIVEENVRKRTPVGGPTPAEQACLNTLLDDSDAAC